MNLPVKQRYTFFYGVGLALSLLLLKWLEFQWLVFHPSLGLYTGGIACLFTLLGIWITLQWTKPQKINLSLSNFESKISTFSFSTNEDAIHKLQLTKRELEVLGLMAEGLSNQQIAECLFVSVNTVKTHTSHLFEKLEVSRRTQAVEKAKKLNIISR